MSRFDDIVGYTFKADQYCPDHIVERLPTGPTEDFDGWALAHGVTMTAEENLDEIAAAFGIDRGDEWSFDTDYFPKVVFLADSEDEQCGVCGKFLDGDQEKTLETREYERRYAHPSDRPHYYVPEL